MSGGGKNKNTESILHFLVIRVGLMTHIALRVEIWSRDFSVGHMLFIIEKTRSAFLDIVKAFDNVKRSPL